MKKIVILMAFGALALAGTAFAGDISSGNVSGEAVELKGKKTGGSAQTIGKLSTGVKLGVNYDNTSYAFITKHKSGTKLYGSAAGDTKLYVQEGTTGDLTTAPSNSDSTDFQTGWSSL
ncbi:hypothetical protein RW64_19780 [Geobacter sulfurreducens]|nr:hypothetical protein RW64_19780 [Geobacter sulfurreducens]